ncbi:MAG TPA: Uma2 family endonuclease [Tepidisphaeraceae bacterium]|jgi:Uma2 family endonuclease
MSTLTTKVTPAELLAMPDAHSTELVNGELVEKEVSRGSSRIGGRIVKLLANVADAADEAEVYPNDLGYQCFPDDPDRVRKPDVSLIRKERLTAVEPDPGFMPIPADLAVEVVSPKDRVADLMRKVDEYLAAGFGLIWVVYPESRRVQVWRADGSTLMLRADDELSGEAALPAFRCKVADLFA